MSEIKINSTNLANIIPGTLRATWSARGDRILRYQVDFGHKTLDLHKELSAADIDALQSKVNALMAAWDLKFETYLESQKLLEDMKKAEQIALDAEEKRQKLRSILRSGLSARHVVDWNIRIDRRVYKGAPFLTPRPQEPVLRQLAERPSHSLAAPTSVIDLPPHPGPVPNQPWYPSPTFLQVLLGQRKHIFSEYRRALANYEEAKRISSEYARAVEEKAVEVRRKESEETFARNLAVFDESVVKIRSENDAKLEEYKKALAKWERDLQKRTEEETRLKADFLTGQAESNRLITELKSKWEEGDAEAIIEHTGLVLDESNYEGLFHSRFDLSYVVEGKVLLIEFELPSPDDLPTTKTARLIPDTGELKLTPISDKEMRSLFDDTCYQICLRTIHEVLSANTHGHIESVVFNGTAEYVEKASGNTVRATIMSLMVSRADFTTLNLQRIDPKACFKSLKGVSAASLSGLAAIPPVMRMDRNDRRFIEGRNVELDDGGETNLASMSWEDFEHLVRELFEKEFATRGGEVKVTQSSRDGGVDAVAFDPDPITGGKIVIQAKRYTQTVGVGAVRDLYGTTLSEGASKGILVTTADYGPDAYKFAIGKPLTLLTGSNLLHLLEKHGVRAKIDLRAARIEAGLSGTKET